MYNVLARTAIFGLLLLGSTQFPSAYPIDRDTLTADDLDVLKTLLGQLETIAERKEVAPFRTVVSEKANSEDNDDQSEMRTNQAKVSKFLLPQDLKAVRSDSATKKSSGCFGRRMDRIGSMSTLGCNTVSRKNS